MTSGRVLVAGGVGVLCAVLLAAPIDRPVPAVGPQPAEQQPAAGDARLLWLVPDDVPADPPLARAVGALDRGDWEAAVDTFASAVDDPAVGPYARVWLGRARLAGNDWQGALQAARVASARPVGTPLGARARWLVVDAAEAGEQWAEALDAVQSLVDVPGVDQAQVHARLARIAEQAGRDDLARAADETVYYDYPASEGAAAAAEALERRAGGAVTGPVERERARAERLFDARRFADARAAFVRLRPRLAGDAGALVDLRVAQCDASTGRYTRAREALRPLSHRRWAHAVEVAYLDLGILRGLREDDAYETAVHGFVAAHADDPLAERALDELGTHLIVIDEDARAAEVFAELHARNPRGAYGDRAAWKAGWWAYRHDDYGTAVRFFEAGLAAYPTADYRPSWRYWAARAQEQAGDVAAAIAQYARTVVDYGNSYYGREATARLRALAGTSPDAARALAGAVRSASAVVDPGGRPAATALVQSLLVAGLYDDAVAELRSASPADGRPPIVEATIAWALNRRGQLRPGITAMRRAYPQFMAAGGEHLPAAVRRVIFPVDHWDLLRRYATLHDLDPFLLAAQVAQESTFQADVRSGANAYGLMQILPATGRRYAQRLGLRGFSTVRLTDPETNVRIGTTYLADLIEQLGDIVPALAAYNAGEQRVAQWQAERPGLPRDEFIDDIPYPETQFYVKRVLGTADDYRALYGPAADAPVTR